MKFMGERRGKQTRGHEVEQRALEVADRNAEFILGPKCHLAGVASSLSRLQAAAKLRPNSKTWSERGDSNPGPLPPQSSAAHKTQQNLGFLFRFVHNRFRSVLINLRRSCGPTLWQPINTAPKDRTILVYGQPEDIDLVTFKRPGTHSAYWDDIDERFCLTGGTWIGPFINPTHWMPVPEPPKDTP